MKRETPISLLQVSTEKTHEQRQAGQGQEVRQFCLQIKRQNDQPKLIHCIFNPFVQGQFGLFLLCRYNIWLMPYTEDNFHALTAELNHLKEYNYKAICQNG